MYKINKVDIDNLTTQEVEDLYSTNSNIVKKYNFLEQFRETSEYRELFLSTFIGSDRELLIIKNDSSICGILNWVKSADWSGKELYKLTIWLCDSIINESLSECLDQFIQQNLNQHGGFAIITYNNELDKLMEKYSYKTNDRGNHYTLKKEDIDINLLNNAIKEFEAKNTNLSIKYTDIISEEYIDQWCNLFDETMDDMTDAREEGYVKFVINPEKQRQINESNKTRNITHHCYMIFNSNNEMVGKSNVSVNNNDPRFPYQFMIGVKRSYRGRNLGKWLYASMYKKLLENVDFEKVHVCHHVENQHAINISEWIGYKLNYLETSYLVSNLKD